MLFLQLTALLIVTLYAVAHMADRAEARRFLSRFALVSMACWGAEESSILLYDFYAYAPAWGLFLDRVPITVILIWPIIIHSAEHLSMQLLNPSHRLVPLATGAIVITDAALIEPVAVHAGLWSWKGPGLFHVPLIGILGWGYFALGVTLAAGWTARQNQSKGNALLLVLFPVLGTHLLIQGTWWLAFRWANAALSPSLVTGVAWCVSVLLVGMILWRKAGRGMEKKTLLLRLPAALLVFILLFSNAAPSPGLLLYALAFVPPYLSLMAQQYATPP